MIGLIASRRTRAALLLWGLGAVGCTDTPQPLLDPDADPDAAPLLEEPRAMKAPRYSTQGVAPALQACGTASSYKFRAGNYVPGTVAVSNDAQNLYVTYAINDATEADRTAGWYISDTRFWLTRTRSAIP